MRFWAVLIIAALILAAVLLLGAVFMSWLEGRYRRQR